MEMNENEIMKALECCEISGDCKSCPRNGVRDGCYNLGRDVLDLINRLKAESEELKCRNQNLTSENENLTSALKSAKAEIERLEEKRRDDDKLLNDRVREAVNSVSKANQKYVDALEKAFNEKVAELKSAKTEAYREFAERLKDKGTSPELDGCKYFNTYDIEKTLTELTGK